MGKEGGKAEVGMTDKCRLAGKWKREKEAGKGEAVGSFREEKE